MASTASGGSSAAIRSRAAATVEPHPGGLLTAGLDGCVLLWPLDGPDLERPCRLLEVGEPVDALTTTGDGTVLASWGGEVWTC